jgi:hypothetical protein
MEARNPNLQPATASGIDGGSTLLSMQQQWASNPQDAFWVAEESEEGSGEWPGNWEASEHAADDDDSTHSSQDPTADCHGSGHDARADGSIDDSQVPSADEVDSEDLDSPDDSDYGSSGSLRKHLGCAQVRPQGPAPGHLQALLAN